MKCRIPTQAQRIEFLRTVRENRINSLQMLKKNEQSWTKSEADLAAEHERVIADCTRQINAFYKPATVI